MRREHLGRESSIKSVGQLCYLVAFFSVLGTVEFALFALGIIPGDEFQKFAPGPLLQILFWGFSVLFALNTLAQVVLGFGLIRLHSWARWTVVVLTGLSLLTSSLSSLVFCVSSASGDLLGPLVGRPISGLAVGLVSFFVGGSIHALILWPLVGPGSGVVFSSEYKQVVLLTPAIRSRMHWLLRGLIVLILASVVGFVAYLMAIYFQIID